MANVSYEDLEVLVGDGLWRLHIDNPRFGEHKDWPRVHFAPLWITQPLPDKEMAKVPGFEARGKADIFIGKIAVEHLETIGAGFLASGPGYALLDNVNGLSVERGVEDDEAPRGRKSRDGTDPYYKGMPGIQTWRATKLRAQRSK